MKLGITFEHYSRGILSLFNTREHERSLISVIVMLIDDESRFIVSVYSADSSGGGEFFLENRKMG
jgi:hypothetical protein